MDMILYYKIKINLKNFKFVKINNYEVIISQKILTTNSYKSIKKIKISKKIDLFFNYILNLMCQKLTLSFFIT